MTTDLQQIGTGIYKMSATEWKAWADGMIRQHELQTQQNRLNQGIGKKVLFTPFCGEFGHLLMHHVRLVHFIRDTTAKIVCTKPGMESLYPTATGFFYDFEYPFGDELKMGTDRQVREWTEIQKQFPDHLMVQSGGLSFSEEKLAISPEIRIPFNIFTPSHDLPPIIVPPIVDVCIGTRTRALNSRQNWPHCQLIADACKKRSLTYATIAHPAVGYHLDGEQCMSGDFPTIDAAIYLLQNCKFYFGQDSGSAHLAATVGVNMSVLEVPHRIWAEEAAKITGLELPPVGRDFIDRMIETNAPYITNRIAPEKWFNPEEVMKDVEPILDGIVPAPTYTPKVQKHKRGKK